ncbi:MAG: HNH endonuclease [Nitrospinaceae bacterium]|nr:HNH endonuclease [Nitrospinaceae bacterium]NIR55023.1 HNH endonuclease [Nitrospinaceae bacterium]NIS85422.1 HNH endonuclease [Nitrospinaceae bacterium]NIT82261.1 HNH endonuclease [Nitrospinaceae bacterium]NIU44491.1 HNH endonuclease [Nitrospinaceae bacterium]
MDYASLGRSRCEVHKPEPGWNDYKPEVPLPSSSKWERIRRRIFRRDKYKCQPCKRRGILSAGQEVDHIVPRSQGGRDTDENLQTICRQCHREKTHAESQQKRGGGSKS